MPLVLDDARFDVVIPFLQTHRSGVTLRQVSNLFTPPMNERTAQRMLSALVTLGMLTKTGYGATLRYRLRLKPGALGRVLWYHADGSAAAVAPPPSLARPAPSVASPADRPIDRSTVIPPAPAARPAAVQTTAVGIQRSPISQPKATASASSPPLPSAGVRPALAGLPPELSREYDGWIKSLIQHGISRKRTQEMLRNAAATSKYPREAVETFSTVLLAELDTIREEAAARYGITLSQFIAWRLGYPAKS